MNKKTYKIYKQNGRGNGNAQERYRGKRPKTEHIEQRGEKELQTHTKFPYQDTMIDTTGRPTKCKSTETYPDLNIPAELEMDTCAEIHLQLQQRAVAEPVRNQSKSTDWETTF